MQMKCFKLIYSKNTFIVLTGLLALIVTHSVKCCMNCTCYFAKLFTFPFLEKPMFQNIIKYFRER